MLLGHVAVVDVLLKTMESRKVRKLRHNLTGDLDVDVVNVDDVIDVVQVESKSNR